LNYFGTLKTAIRLSPKLKVVSNVAAKTRLLPLVVASRQPPPPFDLVILSLPSSLAGL
jgi:hypothetical protein